MKKKYIIKESSLKDNLIELINTKGLSSALDIIGGFNDLVRIVGKGTITREIEENFIRDIVLEHGGISVHDLGEDPVVYKVTKDGEIWEIYYFGIRRVSITIWYEHGFEDRNEINISYENLSDNKINEIFLMLVENYLKGIKL